MRKLIFGVVLAVLLVSNLASISAYNISGTYTDLSGNEQHFNTFSGNLTLIEAFSTECSHCIDYHPTLSSIYSEYNDRIEMLSLSINADDTIDDLKQFKQEHETSWMMGKDSNDIFQESYAIPGTPTTLLFDSNGRVASCMLGNQPQEDVEAELNAFLEDPSGYTSDNLEEGKCKSQSFLSSFVSSIWFPVTLVIVLYYGFILYRKKQS